MQPTQPTPDHSLPPIARPTVAHQVRAALFNQDLATEMREAAIQAEILDALTGRIRGFDIASAATVGPAGVEGRVIVRFDGKVCVLSPLDASVIALVLTGRRDIRAADMFAAAFRLAVHQAHEKVDAVHEWSRAIRPTEDVE